MPDPGEPHPPEPRHYKSFEDYLSALDEYIELTSDPTATEAHQALDEVDHGLDQIEAFLKQQANGGGQG